MKKSFTKIIAFVMCIAMISAVVCVSAYAEQPDEKYSKLNYKYYTYIGDSVSWGYGLDADLDPLSPDSMFVRVEGSFTDIVGDVLEANGAEVHCAACNGARLCDYRVLLEKGLGIEDPYTYPEDTFGKRSIERTRKLQASSDYVCENLGKSDIVTITLGANDLATCIVNSVEAFDFIDIEKLQNVSGLGGALEYAAFALSSAFNQKHMLADFAETLKSQVEALKENQKEVVKDVVALAPEADIFLVGYFVPMDTFRLIPGTDSSMLLELLGTVFTIFNDAYEAIASEYSNVYYVDAPDADIFFEDGTLLFNALISIFADKDSFLLGIHPNADGQKYISERVLEKIVEVNESEEAEETISVLPVRTITYVVSVVSNTVNNVKNKLKNAISSIFKK